MSLLRTHSFLPESGSPFRPWTPSVTPLPISFLVTNPSYHVKILSKLFWLPFRSSVSGRSFQSVVRPYLGHGDEGGPSRNQPTLVGPS